MTEALFLYQGMSASEVERMEEKHVEILQERLDEDNFRKLFNIVIPRLHHFVARYVKLCNPEQVFICTDSGEDLDYIRKRAIENKEEAELSTKGHTIHFDGFYDQARDKERTKFLLPKRVYLGPEINSMDRDEGLTEIHEILANIMEGRELFVKFFCLGPPNSEFTIPCVQLTDSAYVAHSEDILYRQGYQEFATMNYWNPFFRFVHSQGELEEMDSGLMVSKNTDRRRIYIDLHQERIFSVNTQYGGNTLGLKKLAMRLGINRASKMGWLTEHMLVMGVKGPGGRISYFTGAFPSMCGKTSTAMIKGETIVGDDIAYLRKIKGKVRAVNVEKGLFGIIDGINSEDDALQWKALNDPGEIIFSNVLVTHDGDKYWSGKDGAVPENGINYAGKWEKGQKDDNGQEVRPSHKNARFTLDLKMLDNVDENLDNPIGVPVCGMIYGGRDSDTSVPVEEAYDWAHGIVTKGAALESETTAATLGKEGIREFNPMSNLDFLSIPIGRYIKNNVRFCAKMKESPRIFSVNYFLKDSKGNYLNEKNDKRVWLKWMELRVNYEVDAIKAPTGLIPMYLDLKRLFKKYLEKDYSRDEYTRQFSIRIPQNLEKLDRLTKIYEERVLDTPKIIYYVFEAQRERLLEAQDRFGDLIPPAKFLE